MFRFQLEVVSWDTCLSRSRLLPLGWACLFSPLAANGVPRPSWGWVTFLESVRPTSFIQPSALLHSGCFCILTVGPGAIIIVARASFKVLVFWGSVPRLGWLGHIVLVECLREPLYYSPERMQWFPFPRTVQEGALLSTPSPAFMVVEYLRCPFGPVWADTSL